MSDSSTILDGLFILGPLGSKKTWLGSGSCRFRSHRPRLAGSLIPGLSNPLIFSLTFTQIHHSVQ